MARLTSDKAQDALASLNVELADSQGNMRDVVDVYTDVANAMKGMSEVDQMQIVEALSGKYHISRMQQLLNDLGSADSMYRNMLETSQTSEGSALIENEKYMESLQARINLARVEVEKLALTLGEAFVTEGMITFLQVAGDFLKGVASIVSTVGFLPTLFMTASVGALLLSSRFRGLANNLLDTSKATTSTANNTRTLTLSTEGLNRARQRGNATLLANTSSLRTNTTAMQANANATTLGATATRAFTTAWRTLLLASGVGIGLAAIGFVIEKLTSAMGSARQRAEELDSANEMLFETYKNNASEIDDLSDKYEKLSNRIKVTNEETTPEEWEEYYKVQDELGKLLPELVTGEDQYGNKLIVSSEAVKVKSDLLKEQLEIEKQLKEEQDRKDIDANIENYSNANNKTSNKVETGLGTLSNAMDISKYDALSTEFKVEFVDSDGNPLMKTVEDLEVSIRKVKENLSKAKSQGKVDDVSILTKQLNQLEIHYSNLQKSNLDIVSNTNKLKSEYLKSFTLMISENEKLKGSLKETGSTITAQLMNITDSTNANSVGSGLESILDSEIVKDFVKESSTLFEQLGNSTVETFEVNSKAVEKFVDNLPNMLKDFASEDEIKAIQSAFRAMLTASQNDFDSLNGEMKNTGKTVQQAKTDAMALGEASSDASDGVDDLTNSITALETSVDQLVGVSEKQLDYTDELIYLYQMLTSNTMLSREQDELLLKTKNELNNLYPQLLENGELQLDAIKAEVEANKILQEAVKNSMDNKYSAEQNMTLSSALGTKARIENIKKEMLALEELRKSILASLQEATKVNDPAWESRMVSSYKNTVSRQSGLPSILDELQSSLTTSIGTLGSYNTSISESSSSTKKNTSATKDSNKETSQSIYITDEYKLAMERLNTALDKQNAIKAKYSTHSDEYRKALQAEIDLLQQQLKLQKDQHSSLSNQVASGKIKQTGSVSVPTTTSTTSSSSSGSVSVNGYSGAITSKQGMRYHPVYKKNMYHAGIDIAGAKGTRLDSFVDGKVVGQGYNNRSGNYVQIQDGSGNKHFFAHLDKAIAKLGDTIVKGQQIGTIGNTGASKGSHLHYEVKDSSGKYLDAATFAKEARTGKVKTSGTTASTIQSTSSGVVDTGQQAVDEAISALLALESDAVTTQEQIDELTKAMRQSWLDSFTFRKEVLDDLFNREASVMRNSDKWSKQYNDTLWRQIKLIEDKKAVQLEEKAHIESQLQNMELTGAELDDLRFRYGELLVAIEESNSALWENQLKKLDKFVDASERSADIIAYNQKMMETLSTGTERYEKALNSVNEELKNKKEANEAELKGLMHLIDTHEVSGETLEGVIDRVNQLRIGLHDLAIEIQNNNFEIIMNIKTKSDEDIDDIDYDLQKSKIIQSHYTEGSALWNQELEKQIEYQTQIMKMHDDTRRKLKQELFLHETTAERRKEIYETIEDESIAYLNASKAIEDLKKQAEEAKENKLEQIADDVIDRIKDYWNQRKEEEMMRLDDLLEAETDVHEKRMQMLKEEMDLYRKNVEEKLDLIDRQEADRDYNMEMDDLESERGNIQKNINLLSMDNSNEAKAKRKKLQEELDKIDKDIAERKHDRDITLQKESLQQNLEDKEEEISIKEELETERHESEVERINREREYWEKYYEDRLNDEREFERIRQTIMEGNFAEIQALMNKYADQLEGTMYKLEVALNGTMQKAGTAIRQNVIDRLREAFAMIEEFNKSQIIDPTTGLDGANDKVVTDPFDPNKGKDELVAQDVARNNDKEKLTQADLKVLTAKYMNEQLYFDTKDPTDKWWVKYKADTLASTGRQEGSTIRADQTLESVLQDLSKEDLQRLAKFAKELQSTYLNKADHQQHMIEWATEIASLDSGGLVKSNGLGVDGKGGKMAILHPNEIVLKDADTKRFFDNINVSDNLAKTLLSMQNSMAQFLNNMSPTLSGVGGLGGVNIEFTGDIINSNGQTGTTLANQLVNEIRKKGGRI